MTQATTTYLNETKELTAELVSKYKQLYGEFSNEISKHTQSGRTIPDVSKAISDKSISSIGAMRVINDAIYDGMTLTNAYQTIYAPKLNELKYDVSSAVFALTNAFNKDPEVQAIKTSAEKERQLQMFAFEVLQHEREIKKLHESFTYLGKYVESITYSLDRMQRMVDSLDRLQGKEMWVDATAQEQALAIIDDNDDLEQFRPKPKDQTETKKQPIEETQLIDFDDEDF